MTKLLLHTLSILLADVNGVLKRTEERLRKAEKELEVMERAADSLRNELTKAEQRKRQLSSEVCFCRAVGTCKSRRCCCLCCAGEEFGGDRLTVRKRVETE